MSLRERLNRLTGESSNPKPEDPKQARLSELRKKTDEIMGRRDRLVSAHTPPVRKSAIPLESVVTGEEVETAQGKCFFSRSTIKSFDFHGHARLCNLSCTSMEAAAFLAGNDALKNCSIEDGLFLDTETTGLSGGTGTFPFLIGLGWFENKNFITCQLFARDFSEEPSMLAYLNELAANRKFLVSFNGRAYDVNLLATRFILNRSRDIFSGMPHIDLLHPSRRIYSHRLENSRLVTLEAAVLGVIRKDDVPGHEIPQRYFDWLKRRDGRLMEDVFYHNRLDIVSMASLLKHITDLVQGSHDASYPHHVDLLATAKLHQDRGDIDTAKRFYEPLIASGQPDVAKNARMFLSLIHKKSNQWDEAVSLWNEMIAFDPYDLFAAEELAKWYEHHVRDFSMAIKIVQQMLNENHHLAEPKQQVMKHRLRRLLCKNALK
jgi:uncharacterized protein